MELARNTESSFRFGGGRMTPIFFYCRCFVLYAEEAECNPMTASYLNRGTRVWTSGGGSAGFTPFCYSMPLAIKNLWRLQWLESSKAVLDAK